MKRLMNSEFHEQWYYFLLEQYKEFAAVHANVSIDDVIHRNVVEYLWKDLKLKNIFTYKGGVESSLFNRGHFDIVVTLHSTGQIFEVYEVNGPGHDDRNDKTKLLFCIASGTRLWFVNELPVPSGKWNKYHELSFLTTTERAQECNMSLSEYCRKVLKPQDKAIMESRKKTRDILFKEINKRTHKYQTHPKKIKEKLMELSKIQDVNKFVNELLDIDYPNSIRDPKEFSYELLLTDEAKLNIEKKEQIERIKNATALDKGITLQ